MQMRLLNIIFENSSQNRPFFCSAHRPLTEMSLYLPWRFQKVQAHFCGMSVSQAIRRWNWSILSKFIENLKSTKMEKWEIDDIF